jgi:glycopeptide antibiotics resistance protein
MSLDTIITQLGEFLAISIPCVVAITILSFILNRYVFKRNTRIWKILPGFLFVLNIIFIIYLTFLTRSETFGEIDLHLFRSYREAWNTFSIRNWQLVIFNILVFVPFGTLLPVIFRKLRHVFCTVGCGFLFSLSIELLQRVTGRGLCELDDLMNNTVGVLLGYCLFRLFYTLFHKKERWKLVKVIASLLPICMIVSLFGAIFYQYDHQEYGNLSVNYTYQVDLSNVKINTSEFLSLKDQESSAPVFVPKTYTKEDAELFASALLDKMGINGNTRYSYYDDSVVCYRGNHNVTVSLIDQSYEYHFISDKAVTWGDMGAQAVKERLALYGIEIPENAIYSHPSQGSYQWTIERSVDSIGNVSGTISCITTTDGEIYSIMNQMVSQSLYKNEEIISEKEAYNRLIDGYFQIDHTLKIESIIVRDVDLTYSPDTKGFYQPVYLFHCKVNGENRDLVIAALK